MATLERALSEALGSKPAETIRNVCLVAHVDHGKTSFADSLVSVNSIISSRMAGKLRYMDSRPDEQVRGITMKTSGISLLCDPLLINLIDSPGHVDFSGEVTSALILSDIALLLIDVIEGICSQTEALIRQLIQNGQSMILIINKIDRLRIELKMSSDEAYLHIVRLIEGVNSCISQVLSGILLEGDRWDNFEEVEAQLHFNPVRGNVIFSSALHSYAFGLEDFAGVYAEKIKVDRNELLNGMFGDFYLTASGVKEGAAAKGKKTIFEDLILEPLWKIHDYGLVENDLEKLTKLTERLGIKLKSRRAAEAFDEAMRTWLPLPNATFRAVARAPSAKSTFQDLRRINHLTGKRIDHPLRPLITACSSEETTVVFVVKLLQSDEHGRRAICRILSGTLKPGDKLHVLHAQKRVVDSEGSEEAVTTTVKALGMLRGRDVVPIPKVTAGVICAVDADLLLQNTTLCSEPDYPPLNVGSEEGEALVRVSVSTDQLDEMDELREKLKLLSLLDSSLKVLELETGELAMVTAGEVHLQKCVRDLNDLGITNLDVSAPIVPFLETVVPEPTSDKYEIEEKITECRIRRQIARDDEEEDDGSKASESDEKEEVQHQKQATKTALYIRLRVVPLPDSLVELLEKNAKLIGAMKQGDVDDADAKEFEEKFRSICSTQLYTMKGTWWFRKPKEQIESLINRIWSFGPEKARANVMFNAIEGYERKSVWTKDSEESTLRRFDQALTAGFELFCGSGPLCNENMRGVGVIVEKWEVDEEDSAIGGQMMSAMKSTCASAAQKLALRLVAAMYKCTVTTSSQALGKVHAVLAQRKAKVLAEDINEATGLFEVVSLMPVVESFSFCDQLRTGTSGMASAQLHFSHWQIIDENPYWVPTTLEEIEEFGLKGDSPNHARGYMDAVRRRKGLPTEDLIVVSAEKQRNLKRNK
ncbi:unnamed protein product [Caenorhabditis auriculariae]|uniref:Elongation factor-like 1 n=1 Tax=Caenorhabditis auriculariae TaxID=2777116 RepID=A0A8S1HMH9_9PELO|nr:unnamed protein product [Caenorhabditis auriculariae]